MILRRWTFFSSGQVKTWTHNFHLRRVWCSFSILFYVKKENSVCKQCRAWTDATFCGFDLGLRCLPVPIYGLQGTDGLIAFYSKMDRVKRFWYLSPMRTAKFQASLLIRAVSPEPSLLAHISSESRGTFRQKARSLAPLNGWACAVKICHDGMLEDTKKNLRCSHRR